MKSLFFYDTYSGDFPHHSHFTSLSGVILKYDFSLVEFDVDNFELNNDLNFVYINKQATRQGQVHVGYHRMFCVDHEIVALVYNFLKKTNRL
jgi:hypothetical protein